VTTSKSESTTTMMPLVEMDSAYFNPDSYDDSQATAEHDLPAGMEVLTKAQHYVNSVWKIIRLGTDLIYHSSQDVPLLTWKEFFGDYLDACLILEGRGRFHQSWCQS
jgi:hypothetical protein